ncbi:HindVP family restriction endonuclease [Cylindrospermopsis raciborskii]|uniref:HindVP family restriction endonuclease n=1 Tax=Cylindrospermopsis raciborskii TaxID=77022 RepID=UPI0026768FBB|nr:HindVP family restriction endonuclease [Cylindrospermopsis raciborskii]
MGSLPRVDLVTQSRSSGQCLRPIEVKLTALPDNSTCSLTEEYYGCELVVRPNTILYLACSVAANFKNNQKGVAEFIGNNFDNINDWKNGETVFLYVKEMILAIDKIVTSLIDKQEPLLMQTIWKTNGKSPKLNNNCLDVFVWSNLAFTRLFIDAARDEISGGSNRITRQVRTSIMRTVDLFSGCGGLSLGFQNVGKDFILNGSKTDLEQIIGNAVPIKLAEYVANCINEYIKDRNQNKVTTVRQLELIFD